jgi:phage tail-like protein
MQPLTNLNFQVILGDAEPLGFAEVTGLDGTAEVIEYREGGFKTPSPILLPGPRRFGPVTLKRGLAPGIATLAEWWQRTVDGLPDRRTVTVVLLDQDRQPQVRWNLLNAWPSALEGPHLHGLNGAAAIETLVLQVEAIEVTFGG